jgi:DNA-3-methyladenine glycosylase
MERLLGVFFARDTVTVARQLLGQRSVRLVRGQRFGGLICETEAYRGPDDPASHAFRRTKRSDIMYGRPGIAYVYLIYGMHYCFNVVTEPEELPGAVLIRAILPQDGLKIMRSHRGNVPDTRLADGPGKLCQALALSRDHNGFDLSESSELFFEAASVVPEREVRRTPRIGIRGDALTRYRLWRYVWHN